MESRILVAYASNSGSTADIAKAVEAELVAAGELVDARQIKELDGVDLAGYDAIVIGAPMILGWHRDAERFLKTHRSVLSNKPVALFATAMKLTSTGRPAPGALPVFVDPKLAQAARNPGRLGLKERFTTLDHYLNPILKAAGDVEPASIAFFKGKLDFRRLKFLQMFFVMLVVGAQPGDYRNWDAIKQWARELPAKMALE